MPSIMGGSRYQWMWWLLGILAGLPNLSAQTLHFGTNRVIPGVVVEFRAPLTSAARWEAQRARATGGFASGAFVLPAACTNLAQGCPLLIVSAPSGISAIRSLRGFTNAALSEGWAILAADGPPVAAEVDTIQYGWSMLSTVMEQFTRTWPPAKQWPVACAGFSGGAKRSAAVAAALRKNGWRVIGVFMGGCNEDRATLGEQLFQPPPDFKRVPLFLSNGAADPIAGPSHAAKVQAAMTQSGFVNIRAETCPGDHRLNQEHLLQALRWFKSLAAAEPPPKRPM